MKNLMCLLLILLFSWNCSADLDSEINEEVLSCKYGIDVLSKFYLEGVEISWSPSIGSLVLGPESSSGCDPKGTLFMNIKPGQDSLWENVSVLDTSNINLFTFNFFSIQFPCKTNENLESNFYSLKTVDDNGNNVSPFGWLESSKMELKRDGGFVTIRVIGLVLEMKRDIINDADVEENITIAVHFDALEICN